MGIAFQRVWQSKQLEANGRRTIWVRQTGRRLRSRELDGLVQDDGAEDLQGDGEGGDTGGVVEALACHD